MDSLRKVDVDSEVGAGHDDGLTFQDISTHGNGDSSKTHEFTNFPHSAVDSEDEAQEDNAQLLHHDKTPPSSFWTFGYYQQFFDVDTKQVGKRIFGSMYPKPKSNYLAKEIRLNPDLYGPFWICTTLVFTTAIAGNLANYFSSAGKDYHWKYDFHKVTFAATAIYSYWWFIPLILFGMLWWRGIRDSLTFLEIICIYGYSLAIYIPISVLWAIQVSWLQWTLVLIGAVLSGSVLLMNFWPVVSKENKKVALGIMAFIFIMHAALAVGFVFYFFYLPSPSQPSVSPVANVTFAQHPAQQNPDVFLKHGNSDGQRVDKSTENDKQARPVEEGTRKNDDAINPKTSSVISEVPVSSNKDIEPVNKKLVLTNPAGPHSAP